MAWSIICHLGCWPQVVWSGTFNYLPLFYIPHQCFVLYNEHCLPQKKDAHTLFRHCGIFFFFFYCSFSFRTSIYLYYLSDFKYPTPPLQHPKMLPKYHQHIKKRYQRCFSSPQYMISVFFFFLLLLTLIYII